MIVYRLKTLENAKNISQVFNADPLPRKSTSNGVIAIQEVVKLNEEAFSMRERNSRVHVKKN